MCEISSVAVLRSILYFVGPREPQACKRYCIQVRISHSNCVLQNAGKYGIRLFDGDGELKFLIGVLRESLRVNEVRRAFFKPSTDRTLWRRLSAFRALLPLLGSNTA